MALKILLADDSMTAQNLGKKILTDAGYDVVTVSNGAAAVRKIAEVKPQVCILDIYMPGYTGLEVCARVKNSGPTSRIPVLLTVGKMEPYKPEEGARVRADGVIVKPFEATELLRAVQRFANRGHAAAKPAAPPLGPANSVEKTIRLTREQIQEMMDPDSQEWRDNAAKPPPKPSAETAATPVFSVDDMLSSLQSSTESPSAAASVNESFGPFLATLTGEPPAHGENASVNVAALEEMGLRDDPVSAAADRTSAALPGFVDYVVASEATGSVTRGDSAPASQTAAVATLPEIRTAAKDSSPAAEATPAVVPVVPPEASLPAIDDTQKLDPDVLAAARRASLAAEASLRIEAAQAVGAERETADVPKALVPDAKQAPAPAATIAPEADKDSQPEIAAPAAATAERIPVAIPSVDSKLEVVPPVAIHAVPDPNLQMPVSDKADIVPEPGLEPTSLTDVKSHVPVTRDPDLATYAADPGVSPKNGAGHAAAPEPEFAVTESPLPGKPTVSRDVPEEIAAALEAFATQIAVAGTAQASAGAPRQRYWVADEVAVAETEMTVSLLEEMQRSKSLREQKPADGASMPEATVRDDRNSPDSTAVPGAGGTARSTHEVAPAGELAAAMAAAFGGALPSSDLARAEATQPISEEVRRFALGDAYKPKSRATFSGAAIGDAEEISTSGSINELRLAKAINRAIDRLKPQLVAEILKELKSLEE